MENDLVADLVDKWRREAEGLRRYGAEAQAMAIEELARELAAALDAERFEAITLDEAVKESNYSYSAIQKMVASGDLKNVGRKGSPRVRKGDLPKKAKASHSSGLADSILQVA